MKKDPFVSEYSKLIGKKVKAIAKSPADRYMDQAYGLVFEDDTVAWIMRDPEGNGPGFLAIEKGEK